MGVLHFTPLHVHTTTLADSGDVCRSHAYELGACAAKVALRHRQAGCRGLAEMSPALIDRRVDLR